MGFLSNLSKPMNINGDNTQLNNFRTITFILIISKVFEKIMYDKINNSLNKHNIFN